MYTSAIGMVFWRTFDDAFMYTPKWEISCLLARLFSQGPQAGPDLDRYVTRFDSAAGNDRIVTDANLTTTCGDLPPETAKLLKELFEAQLEVMADKVPTSPASNVPDFDDLAKAFIDFGQGTLVDTPQDAPERPAQDMVHTMDVSTGAKLEIVGYRRWYAIARVATFLNSSDAQFVAIWMRICRLIGTAWQIQTAVLQSRQPLEGIPLQKCIDKWKNLDWSKMDAEFIDRQPSPCS